jgi:hypothetical protein
MSTSSSSLETSLFLLELAFTAVRTLSKKMSSWQLHGPRQRKAGIDELNLVY